MSVFAYVLTRSEVKGIEASFELCGYVVPSYVYPLGPKIPEGGQCNNQPKDASAFVRPTLCDRHSTSLALAWPPGEDCLGGGWSGGEEPQSLLAEEAGI